MRTPLRQPAEAPSESADLARIRRATRGRVAQLDEHLFDSRHVTWRVNREGAVLLGGGRALLMQVAHPLVAAGVAAHSRFREEPLARLWRTLDLMLTIGFARAGDAVAAVRAIEHVHARVHGRLREPVGPFPRGTAYRASDPQLLLWVHATLVDSALVAYERFVAPLRPAERAAYYEESKVVARLFRIPERLIPVSFGDFEAYMGAMLAGDTLAVSAEAREIAASIMWPPLAPGLRHAVAAVAAASVGLLPPVLRQRYELSWGPGRDAALNLLGRGSRIVLPLLPESLRTIDRTRT